MKFTTTIRKAFVWIPVLLLALPVGRSLAQAPSSPHAAAETARQTLKPLNTLATMFLSADGPGRIIDTEKTLKKIAGEGYGLSEFTTTLKSQERLYCKTMKPEKGSEEKRTVTSPHVALAELLRSAKKEIREQYLTLTNPTSEERWRRLVESTHENWIDRELQNLAYELPLTTGAKKALKRLSANAMDRGDNFEASLYGEKLMLDYPNFCEGEPQSCLRIAFALQRSHQPKKAAELIGQLKALKHKPYLGRAVSWEEVEKNLTVAKGPLTPPNWIEPLGAPELDDETSLTPENTKFYFILSLFGAEELSKRFPPDPFLEAPCAYLEAAWASFSFFGRARDHREHLIREELASAPTASLIEELVWNRSRQSFILALLEQRNLSEQEVRTLLFLAFNSDTNRFAPPNRHAAVLMVGKLGPRLIAHLPRLEKGLFSTDDTVKEAAADTFARLGPHAKKSVPALKKALSANNDARIIRSLLTALERMGPDAKEAIPEIESRLHHPDPEIRERAKHALASIGAAL